MAISAYGPQGRLKKHPLLGTSMLSDPSRKDAVKQFRGLHQEAVASKDTSRAAGVKRLSKKYETFAAPHTTRLGEIAKLQKGLGEKSQALRDPAREAKLTEKQKEYQEISSKLEGLSGQALVDAHKTTTYQQGVEAAKYYHDLRTRNKAIDLGFGGGADWVKREATTPTGDDPIYRASEWPGAAGGSPENAIEAGLFGVGPGVAGSQYFKNYYAMRLAEAQGQTTNYEDKVNAEIDMLNQSFLPLEEERVDRSKRLQDRADLYNMFLGT